jgi:hypothetical protein
MRVPDGETVYEVLEEEGKPHFYASWPVYTPEERCGSRWFPVAEQQRSAWTACMIVAAGIWKGRPEMSVDALEEQVAAAVRRLEAANGLESQDRIAMLCDDEHRVVRTILVIDLALDQFQRKPRQ